MADQQAATRSAPAAGELSRSGAVPGPGDYVLAPVTVDDAADYVGCHVQCLAETYAAIMPPEFAELHRRAVPRRVQELRRSWADSAAGEDPTRAWIARDPTGAAVGVARSGPGPQPWELEMGAPATPLDFELHHIYTVQRTHGSGLGQALLDTAVGGADAYLWILHGNARAERFYRRNGFRPDGAEMSCGPSWFHRSMFRMARQQS